MVTAKQVLWNDLRYYHGIELNDISLSFLNLLYSKVHFLRFFGKHSIIIDDWTCNEVSLWLFIEVLLHKAQRNGSNIRNMNEMYLCKTTKQTEISMEKLQINNEKMKESKK